MSFNNLFGKNFPRELELLCTYIDDTFKFFKKYQYTVKWTTLGKDLSEYGFYMHNSDKTADVFIGLWWDLWEDNGYPLCLSLNWEKSVFTTDVLQSRLKTFFANHQDKFGEFIIKETYPTLCFKLDYLNSLEDEKPLIDLLQQLMTDLGLSYGGFRKG